MNRKILTSVALVIGIVLGVTLGTFISASFTTSRTVGGMVTVVGSQGLVLNTTLLNFGGMIANQTKIVAFSLSNTGCCMLNLSYAVNIGNLPAPSVLLFGMYSSATTPPLVGMPKQIPASSIVTYGLQLTLGTMAVYGRTYSFNVTITAFT
jgi:hypothetical protein